MDSVQLMSREFRDARVQETVRPKRSLAVEKTAILKQDKPEIDKLVKSMNARFESDPKGAAEEAEMILENFLNY